MKYSYRWLKEHIAQPLPPAGEIARVVTMQAFEVEETVASADGDTIFDIKVLPDRAHDALSHRGMAREIAALFTLPRKEREAATVGADPTVADVRVTVEDSKCTPRYIGVRVENVTIEPSSPAIVAKLGAIGARAINNIVDLTNFILFDIGQPMHAFDAAKVAGGITVRLAKRGETMTTLDGKELTFDGGETVIADDEGVLALAGVKGGTKAQVDEETSEIIVECANFDPIATRKSSTLHNIKTDASKRYENGMTSALAGEAIVHMLGMLKEILPEAKIGKIIDVYPSPEKGGHTITVSLDGLNGLLGTTMTEGDVEAILRDRLHFAHTMKDGSFVVTIPIERLDLSITEDLIEEIGRHYGYDKITPTLPKPARKGLPNKRLYYANMIRNMLTERGFSEVYTYAFAVKGEGDTEVMNPVGKDRPFIRRALAPGLSRALLANYFNAPLIGIDDVRIFEIGNVFPESGEHMSLAFGGRTAGKKKIPALKSVMTSVASEIERLLGVDAVTWSEHDEPEALTIETDLDTLIEMLPEPTTYLPLGTPLGEMRYASLSPYPFIVRDVALWVPEETASEDIGKVIRAHAGELAVRIALFDAFTKEGKCSYAFRIVLQSFERTLEDREANEVYDRVVKALIAHNSAWEPRV